MNNTATVFPEVTPEMKEKLDRFAEEHDGAPLGGIGSSVLFEDDKVKIWEMTLQPGEASDLHRHEYDYYLVIFTGDLMAGVTPKGSPVESFIGEIPPGGNTVRVPKGNTEWAWNIGEVAYSEILIELKDS